MGTSWSCRKKVVRSDSAAAFPYPRTIPLDCSQQWQETPTVEQLRGLLQSYVKGENIGVPSVSLKVSFVALWQTEEYKDVAPAGDWLCDTATECDFRSLVLTQRQKWLLMFMMLWRRDTTA